MTLERSGGGASDRPPRSVGQRLEELKALLDAVVDGTTDAIWVVSTSGRIVLCNAAAAKLLGVGIEGLRDRRVAEVFPPAMAMRLDEGTRRVLASGEPESGEDQLVRPGGERRALLTLQIPYRDRDGSTRGVVAIARDITDRKRSEDNLRKYVDAIVRVRDEERRQIARELHDEAGQALTSMLVRLRALERDVRVRSEESLQARLTDIVQVGEQLHGELGRLARGLHPGVLENLGLEAALSHLAAQARKGGLRVDVELRPGPRLPRPIELAAYRIVQESTTNVVKHAGARTLRISADWSDGSSALRLAVEDDGIGFDPSALADGIGLLGIRERVRQLAGELLVTAGSRAAAGTGTRIEVSIPLEKTDNAP